MYSIKNGAKLRISNEISKSIILNITQLTHTKRAKPFVHTDSHRLLKIAYNLFYNIFIPI